MESNAVQDAPPVGIPMETVTTRAVNTSGPGPFYVYLPSFEIHDLMRMTHLFNSIPAGQVFRITSTEDWYAKEHLSELHPARETTIKDFFGHTKGINQSIEIPAQAILDSLFADRALTTHGLVQFESFARVADVDHLTLNRMIQPIAVSELDAPRELRQRIETEGMLRIRQRWLEEAAEALETGRVLEDYRRVIDARPMLRDLWYDAIVKVMIPAVSAFEITANTILAQKEEAIRSGQKAVYDTYDHTLMWLLARKPERTALSRTLEAGANKGVGIEEIRALVQEVVGAKAAPVEAVREQIQCVECGEFLNMVAGGPPRKCRYCGHEFFLVATAATIEADQAFGPVVSAITETEGASASAVVDPETEDLADQIIAQNVSKKARR